MTLPDSVKQKIIGFESFLVTHGSKAVYPVAEIEIAQATASGMVNEGEDIESARTQVTKIWIEVEINGVQPSCTAIDDADADQSAPLRIAELEGIGHRIEEKAGVVVAGTAVFFRISAGQKAVKQLDSLLADAEWTDFYLGKVVFLQDPTLIAVGDKFHRQDLYGNALLAVSTGHAVQAIAVPAVTGIQKKPEEVFRQIAKRRLPVKRGIRLVIRTSGAYLEKKFFQMVTD
jgi:hypothetical protein